MLKAFSSAAFAVALNEKEEMCACIGSVCRPTFQDRQTILWVIVCALGTTHFTVTNTHTHTSIAFEMR